MFAHERTSHAGIALNQETLTSVIGVRREGVTVAAGKLQKAELIRKGSVRLLLTGSQRLVFPFAWERAKPGIDRSCIQTALATVR